MWAQKPNYMCSYSCAGGVVQPKQQWQTIPEQKANFSVAAAATSFVALTGSGNNFYDHWGRK